MQPPPQLNVLGAHPELGVLDIAEGSGDRGRPVAFPLGVVPRVLHFTPQSVSSLPSSQSYSQSQTKFLGMHMRLSKHKNSSFVHRDAC